MANKKRLIDAEAVRDALYDVGAITMKGVKIINQFPIVDAVPTGVLSQVRWERDVAIEQLKDHGIPFGGIAPDVVKVVRCKDCKHRGDAMYCPMCFEKISEWDDDGYMEVDFITHDQTFDDGFCYRGEKLTDNES